MSWSDRNLAVQGYRMSAEESHALRWGLRFPTALCLGLVVTGLALQSAVLLLALVPVGAVAGWTPRHPFDLIWNRGLRHLSGAPELPPNPRPAAMGSSWRRSGSWRSACCSPSVSRPPR
jgi:hypothetical protein